MSDLVLGIIILIGIIMAVYNLKKKYFCREYSGQINFLDDNGGIMQITDLGAMGLATHLAYAIG